jgi:hypothetical protein
MEPGLPVTITADLVMFDGLPGRVRVGQFTIAGSASWWAAWLGTGGGSISFEDGKWVRLDLDGNPVLPLFRINNQAKENDDGTRPL